jgi:serine/threonine protein kinase
MTSHSFSSRLGGTDVQDILREILENHKQLLEQKDSSVCKNSPETAVTIVTVHQSVRVCVKEYRWRGLLHALKSLGRPSHGLRTFFNGQKLHDYGIRAAGPLALIQERFLGLPLTEWVVMEVVPRAMELDRYILKKKSDWLSPDKRRAFVRQVGEFVGLLHREGIFHSDLKTCNILISESDETEKPCSNLMNVTGEDHRVHSEPLICPIDYDDVIFRRHIPVKKRAKNLAQLFLSTPLVITLTDRLRFLDAYCSASDMSRTQRRALAAMVLSKVLHRQILYVSVSGDVEESWDVSGR